MNLPDRPAASGEGAKAFSFSLHTDTAPHHVRIVRKVLAATLTASGADRSFVTDVEIAVGEALANAYRHGYVGAPGPIEIDIAGVWVGATAMTWTISVHDHGRGVTPPIVPEALAPHSASGMGLYLIAKLMDRVTIVVNPATGKGVSITMEKTTPLAQPRVP
jgi:anti-sigma regulatory factor (Ser/Thr protein kinase)